MSGDAIFAGAMLAVIFGAIGVGLGRFWTRAETKCMNRAFLNACEQADNARRMPAFYGLHADDVPVLEALAAIESDLADLNGTRGNVEKVGWVCKQGLARIRALEALARARRETQPI